MTAPEQEPRPENTVTENQAIEEGLAPLEQDEPAGSGAGQDEVDVLDEVDALTE
jgi:hypothetical protein